MTASRTISIRLTVAEADQFKAAFGQSGAAVRYRHTNRACSTSSFLKILP